MRKIIFKTGILFVGLSLLILSCSKDSENSQDTNTEYFNKITKNEQTAAKNLFINMIKTSDYSSYKSSVDAFVDKMKDNAVYFKTKTEYMNWITANISNTSFTSTQEFSSMLDDIVAKHAIVVTKNSQLFAYIDNADDEQVLEIIKPSLAARQVVTLSNSCANQCISDYEFAMNGNDWAYEINYNTNSHAFAVQYYWVRIKSITDTLSNCMYFC